MHKICIKYEITVSGRLELMEQSDLDTSVNQKGLNPQKNTDTSWYSQDTITRRSVSFPTVEYPSRCPIADDITLCRSSVLPQASLGCTHFACWLIWVCSNDPDILTSGLCKIHSMASGARKTLVEIVGKGGRGSRASSERLPQVAPFWLFTQITVESWRMILS